MAKASLKQRNQNKIMTAEKFSSKRRELKAIINDKTKPLEERFRTQLLLAGLPRNASPTRVCNMCDLTGRTRGFYRDFRMSRICLRELASKGDLPGVIKASW